MNRVILGKRCLRPGPWEGPMQLRTRRQRSLAVLVTLPIVALLGAAPALADGVTGTVSNTTDAGSSTTGGATDTVSNTSGGATDTGSNTTSTATDTVSNTA